MKRRNVLWPLQTNNGALLCKIAIQESSPLLVRLSWLLVGSPFRSISRQIRVEEKSMKKDRIKDK